MIAIAQNNAERREGGKKNVDKRKDIEVGTRFKESPNEIEALENIAKRPRMATIKPDTDKGGGAI